MATRDTNAKFAGIGSDAVRAKTGKNWTEWIDALDRAGARTLAHADIAALVHEKFGVGPWWTQMVAVGYEQATGKRVRMQKADGFAAGASKSMQYSRITSAPAAERMKRYWAAALGRLAITVG